MDLLNNYLKQLGDEADEWLADIVKELEELDPDEFSEEAIIEELEAERDRRAIWDYILTEPEKKNI